MKVRILFIKFISICMFFGIPFLITNIFTTEDYGFYAKVIALISLSSIIFLLGIDKFLIKKFKYDNGILFSAIKTIAFNIIILSLILYILFDLGFNFKNLSMTLLLFLFSMILSISGSLKSIGSIITNETIFNILRPLVLIIMLLIFGTSGYKNYLLPETIVLVSLISSFLLCLLVQLIIIFKKTKLSLSDFGNGSYIKINQFLPFFLIGFGTAAINYIDIVIGGFFLSNLDIAKYSISIKFASVPIMISAVIYQLLIPAIQQWSNEKNELVPKEVFKSISFVAFLSVIYFLMIISFGEQIFALFNINYDEVSKLFYVLFFGNLISILCGPCFIIANILGGEITATKVSLSGIAFFILTSFILIQALGIYGLAISYASTVILMNVTLTIINIKKTKLNFYKIILENK